ncbi:unnamed protein product [Pieris macdunnoughi]|uniref:Uncharacterized protein n=1 Tax=Pieris macdunnoughi TaxID=345717 RepID=A0A821UJS9_9NEOP|nr:unnamed protein product [Pieris macdunnoughi]
MSVLVCLDPNQTCLALERRPKISHRRLQARLGEIKTAVTAAVKRLYELVRDGELQDKDKRDDQPSKVTNQAEAKKPERKETAKEGELDKRIENLK